MGIVVGDLTIKEQTKSVTLFVTFNFYGAHPLAEFFPDFYGGAEYASFSARTTVLRSEHGLGLYAPLTSDEVEIKIEAELRKQN